MATAAPADTADTTRAPDGNIDPDASDTGARQLTEVERLASEMGWNPDHQPKDGKPSRTASEWIKSTERNNRNLRQEVKDLSKSIERIAAVADRQVKREVEQRAAEIEERFAAAVDAKDGKAAAKAANDMRELEREAAPAPAKGDDHEARFKQDNAWYGSNRAATAFAVAESGRLAAEGVTDPAENLRRVREEVMKEFPALNGDAKPAAKDPPSLGEPGARGGAPRAREKTYADLPEIAKGAAERMYSNMKMRYGDKAPDRKAYDAQYAKDYWAEQA